MSRYPLPSPRHPAAPGVLRRAGRVIAGLVAAILLLVLLAGVPYGLARTVGWPLPHHLPTLADIEATLTGPFTDRILLDTLACLCWLVWAVFAADTIRALPEAMHSTRGAGPRPRTRTVDGVDGRRSGPLRGLAAVLLTAIVTGLLSLRPHPVSLTGGSVDAPTVVTAAQPTIVTTSVPVAAEHPSDRASGSNTVTVQAPHEGIHDSLWRVAARCLGEGTRWPEIYRLNHGLPQPDGGSLRSPSLIQPGWVLRLPPVTPGGAGSSAPRTASSPQTRAGHVPPGTGAPSPVTPTHPTPDRTPSTPRTPTPASPGSASPTVTPSVSRPLVHATGRGGGVEIGDGTLVGLGLAGAISTALLVTRRRRRRFYVPGSGRRDDLLPAAPVVRTLHLAYLRASAQTVPSTDQDEGTGAEAEADVDVGPHRAHAHPPNGAGRSTDSGATAADSRLPASRDPDARGVASGDAPPSSVSAGLANGQEVAIDLAGLRGVGLVGPGAPGAARALIVHLLATTVPGQTADAGPEVLIPTDAAKALRLPAPARCPARLRVVDDLAGALDAAETQLLRRARLTRAASTGSGRGAPAGLELVVVSSVPADTRRLQAVLDAGADAVVGAILLGQWRPETSLYVDADGSVTATNPGPGEALRGARLYCVTPADATELLGQLHAAEPGEHSDHPAPANGDVAVNVPEPGADRADTTARQRPRRGVREASSGISSRVWSISPDEAGPPADGIDVPTAPVADPAAAASAPHRPPRLDRLGGQAALVLRVLGPVQLTWTPADAPAHQAPLSATPVGPVDITGALSSRLRELLVLLALHPEGITRARLADTLWPDTTAGRPFATLNKNLVRLRHAIAAATMGHVAEIVLASGDRHRLDPEVIATDFGVFSGALAVRRAAGGDEQRAAAYRAVVGAYRGELGEGLPAEWLETSREAVRRDAVDAATSLARLLAGTDVRAALDMLETGRAFDPYNEAIYRDIMRLQRRLGQPDAIERTLALLATRLTELGERPAPETVALARRLHSVTDPPTGSAATRPAQPTRR